MACLVKLATVLFCTQLATKRDVLNGLAAGPSIATIIWQGVKCPTKLANSLPDRILKILTRSCKFDGWECRRLPFGGNECRRRRIESNHDEDDCDTTEVFFMGGGSASVLWLILMAVAWAVKKLLFGRRRRTGSNLVELANRQRLVEPPMEQTEDRRNQIINLDNSSPNRHAEQNPQMAAEQNRVPIDQVEARRLLQERTPVRISSAPSPRNFQAELRHLRDHGIIDAENVII